MEPIASKFTEQLKQIAGLLNRTLWWMFFITLVALAGIICYVIVYHDEPICLGVIAIGSGALVVTCALCWLGFFSKRLLDVQDGCRQQLFETELSLYRESVRREGLIQNKETVIAQLDLDIEAKRREIELAKLEKELKDLKNPK